MRANQPLDLYELVHHLRQQRAGSVQTVDQYLYIYTVLLRWVFLAFSFNDSFNFPIQFFRFAINKAHRGHIQLPDTAAAERLIQSIVNRIRR